MPAGVPMTVVYIATSKNLAGWAADVGLTKHVYKLGVAEGSGDDAIKVLNDDGFAGESDWRLLKQQEVEDLEEPAAVERMAKKEKMIDPKYYPKIRGAVGIFKIKIGNVANHLLVKRALAGDEQKLDKVKSADIAAYLIQNALP
jgi:hypothetical protein